MERRRFFTELSDCFPIWNELAQADRQTLQASAVLRSVRAGTVLHNGTSDCVGLIAVASGQLRAYLMSDEGREVTLYRLFPRDVCLFSASCMLHSIQFEIIVEAEKDSAFYLIPADIYKALMERSLPVANFTNQLMASRFSEVMWLIEQIMWKSFDKRLAAFLIDESGIAGSALLEITHERIAAHLGTAREVVTRMLRYFQSNGMVRLSRGSIELTDIKALEALSR